MSGVFFLDEGRNLNQLDDFMECLSKFTRYNSVRPLATLSYASDLYNGSSIVSRYDEAKHGLIHLAASIFNDSVCHKQDSEQACVSHMVKL